MKDYERDMMRKIILSMVKKGHVHWTDLKKRVLGSCHPFATDSTFAHQMRYLLRNGHIERVERGIYRITDKGEKYLEILPDEDSRPLVCSSQKPHRSFQRPA